jgi:hypothetical protein
VTQEPAPAAWSPWIKRSQTHAWPQVRSAALDRVHSPCDADLTRTLGSIADETKREGDAEFAVARAAMAALGRCEQPTAQAQLEGIVRKHKLDKDWRGEAARQLVRHYGETGAAVVAKALDREADLATSLRFIRELRLNPAAATPTVQRALCDARETQELAAELHKSLLVLFGTSDPCDG